MHAFFGHFWPFFWSFFGHFFGHFFSLFWPFFEVPFRSTILPEFSFMVWKNAVFFSGTSAAKLGDFQGHFCYHFLSFLALKKMSLFKSYHRARKSYHRARAEKRVWDEAPRLPSLKLNRYDIKLYKFCCDAL